MRATSGRAVSAAIHQRLKDALAQGEPLTYQQLAEEASCTVRSVRNYLARAEEIFGFSVEKSRDRDHRVVVRAVGLAGLDNRQEAQAHPFDGALARALFGGNEASAPGGVVVSMRGMPAYGLHHARLAERWAELARESSPTALRLQLETPTAQVVLWPIALVVHCPSGVVLVGAPPAAQHAAEVVTLSLTSVCDDADAVQEVPDAALPAFAAADVDVEALLDLPFTGVRSDPREPMVKVHVRFEPALGARLARCVWHRTQRAVLRSDGQLDVRFGPVALRQAASWAAAFGSGIDVLGDKKLRKAIKKKAFAP